MSPRLAASDITLSNIRAKVAMQGLVAPEPVRVPARGHAAVLVPLFRDSDASLRVILTQRALDLRSHPGETAFPGGKVDEGEGTVEAAFRECYEEIGVDIQSLVDTRRAEVLAVLDPLLSKHLLSVTPVVVFLSDVQALSDLPIKINEQEVAAVYTAPVDLFLRTDGHAHHDVDIVLEDTTHDVRVHSWSYASRDAQRVASTAEEGPFRIWGLTGWVLVYVAMMGYQENVAFELRGSGGLSLGDFVPL